MNSQRHSPLRLLVLVGLLASPAFGQAAAPPASPAAPKPWYENVKLSGYVFGDAYGVVGHHDSTIEDQTGFWIRRAYLTFDYGIADKWSARLRLEANSPGDFRTNAKLDPFVKDAYLAWKNSGKELYLGISPSPTWEYVEGFWGYRSIEKTPADLYRMGSSRDFGIAYKGKSSSGKVFTHAMVGNGNGEGSETNEGKKAMVAVGFKPAEAWSIELQADSEDRPGGTDRSMTQAFLGWKGKKARVGLQYLHQDRQVPGGDDTTLAVGSLFGVWELSDRYSVLGRFDRSFDPNPEADRIPYLVLAKGFEFDFALIGVEYRINKKISLTPNLELVTYRDTEGRPAPDDDLVARLSLFFQF